MVDNKESKLHEENLEEDLNKCEGECCECEANEEVASESDKSQETVMDFTDILKGKVDNLEEELKLSNNKLNAVNDRLVRVSAEYENFRKRTSKEKENIYTDACADVLKEFLPVLDNLERAVSTDGNIEEFKKGIEMIIRGFEGSLENLNVETLDSTGEFDPNLHNAVMHVEDEAYGKNQIIEVFQKGYKRGDKVLRYSMVKVVN